MHQARLYTQLIREDGLLHICPRCIRIATHSLKQRLRNNAWHCDCESRIHRAASLRAWTIAVTRRYTKVLLLNLLGVCVSCYRLKTWNTFRSPCESRKLHLKEECRMKWGLSCDQTARAARISRRARGVKVAIGPRAPRHAKQSWKTSSRQKTCHCSSNSWVICSVTPNSWKGSKWILKARGI